MMQHFNDMQKYCVKPDLPIYGSLINALGKQGLVDKMLHYFEEMKTAGQTHRK